jgi:2-polyprenyl-6-hydroxyphenyl methylase/3-demethylubiquinone-9 3-methyltransferase
MQSNVEPLSYRWDSGIPCTSEFLYSPLQRLLVKYACLSEQQGSARILDLGCGNGALAEQLLHWGFEVVGVDPSQSGIRQASARCPGLEFHQASAEACELAALGLSGFDIVVSTEVVEHCYAPRLWAGAALSVLRPGGILICSTPYHGYLKNLALALSGKLDSHFTALWDGGHIKFWSRGTLTTLLQEEGFEVLEFRGAGRLPWLWKSMLIAARKPTA